MKYNVQVHVATSVAYTIEANSSEEALELTKQQFKNKEKKPGWVWRDETKYTIYPEIEGLYESVRIPTQIEYGWESDEGKSENKENL